MIEAKNQDISLLNGHRHVIQENISTYFDKNEPKMISNLESFLFFSPVVGVFEVRLDYREDGDEVYFGQENYKYEELIDDLGNKRENEVFHAVVLLDCVEACGDFFHCLSKYIHGDPTKNICKDHIAWLNYRVLRETDYGVSLPPVHPPPVLQSLKQCTSL